MKKRILGAVFGLFLGLILAACGDSAANSDSAKNGGSAVSGESATNAAPASATANGASANGAASTENAAASDSAKTAEASKASEASSKPKSGQFTPYNAGDKIELKSVLGQSVTVERVEGGFKLAGSDKIIMFDIFGTYCDPCQREAPHLMDYQVKNSDDFMIIGLIHFENIDDKGVIERFSKKYNAYYFIANGPENGRLVEQILRDIEYKPALSIPFKVVLKNGVYQTLTDTLGTKTDNKFYLGEVRSAVIAKDIERVRGQ